MGHPMRIELTRAGLLVYLANHYTTRGALSGHGSNGNEGVLHIPQSFSITGASPSDCLMSYAGHSLGEFYPSAEMQSVYSSAPTNWPRCLI